MLPFWNKAGFYIYLGESFLAVTQLTGRWRLSVARQEILSFNPHECGSAVHVFELWLQANRGLSRSDSLFITLGSLQSPVLVLPWSPDLVRPAFRDALASALFDKQLQRPISEYAVEYGPVCFEQPLVAAFLDRATISGWQALASRQKLNLQSVRPLLTTVWDTFHTPLSRESGRLALLEGERVVTVHHAGGCLQRVSARPLDLTSLSSSLQGKEGEAVSVFGPHDEVLASSKGVRTLGLRNHRGERIEHPHALALCGVF